MADRPFHLTAGVQALVAKLRDAGKYVYLVSGGFRIQIDPIADLLQIPRERVVANVIFFDNVTGEYEGFDTTEPTCRDMGKHRALEPLQQAGNYQTMVMIGDGATDAQAKPPAAAFIGYGGVIVRDNVKRIADWFVTDYDDLIRIIDKYGQH